MNAPIRTDGAQAPAPAARGGGRGRGGRGGTNRQPARPNPVQTGKGKVGPNRILDADWAKDSVMKDTAFVIWLSSGVTGDQQWTFHRPIGETPLDAKRQWVATPTRDIGFLLSRRDSEALMTWKRQSELAVRQETLRHRRGRRVTEEQTEVWTFDGAPAIQPTIRTCMAAAKAAGASESAWLDYADRAVQVAERTFKESLRTQAVPRGWVRVNPKPVHETCGGPLGDQQQQAVPFLNGLSLSASKDKVLRVAIGVEHNAPLELPTDDESDGDEDNGGATIVSSPVATANAVPTDKSVKEKSWADQAEESANAAPKATSPPPKGGGNGKASSSKKP